ncbi:carbohydrate kinase [soil metagenome]
MVIICLGEALIDLVPPSGKHPGMSDFLTVQPGGAPLNVAVGLSRLGCDSMFLGCLSEDSFGQRLAGVLDGEQITCIPGAPVSSPTRLAVIDHSNEAAPFRFYGDRPADSRLSTADVDYAFQLPDITGLYVSSLMMTNRHGRDVQQYAIDCAIERGIDVYTDPNPRPAAWSSREEMFDATWQLYNRCAVGKLSIDDARALGWPDKPDDLFAWWTARFRGDLFLTGGASGLWMMIREELVHVQSLAVQPVDPTGAGDASFAALIAQIHDSREVTVSKLQFSAASGTLATLKRGAVAALPTTDDVNAFLSGWN